MDPLPHEPRTFREIVEADLRRAARLLVKVQDEIDPQIRVATPEGDFWIACTLPPSDDGRQTILRALGTFMVWKQATGFTWAAELHEPRAIYCAGISLSERIGCLTQIRGGTPPWTSASFGLIEWLPSSTMDPVLAELLPIAPRPMTPMEVSAMMSWFGQAGRFPAVHIPSGEVRGA